MRGNCHCHLPSCRHCKKFHEKNPDGTYGACTKCPALGRVCEVFI